MTTIHIPEVLDGAGRHVAATVSIRLERAPQTPGEAWRPTIGIAESGFVSECRSIEIPPGGVSVQLVAQSALRLPDGATTAYAVHINTPHRSERLRITVPESAAPMTLRDLVDAFTHDI
ncbi:MAG: hypothetical protein EOM91_15520 [Sphingobacteriia bacterium]|nr:hypothetical protein [Sphingobacteriia bacterium]